MIRWLSAVSLLLAGLPAFAEIAGEAPTSEQFGTLGFVLFGILFVAMCVGFVWLVIWNDKRQKAKEGKE